LNWHCLGRASQPATPSCFESAAPLTRFPLGYTYGTHRLCLVTVASVARLCWPGHVLSKRTSDTLRAPVHPAWQAAVNLLFVAAWLLAQEASGRRPSPVLPALPRCCRCVLCLSGRKPLAALTALFLNRVAGCCLPHQTCAELRAPPGACRAGTSPLPESPLQALVRCRSGFLRAPAAEFAPTGVLGGAGLQRALPLWTQASWAEHASQSSRPLYLPEGSEARTPDGAGTRFA